MNNAASDVADAENTPENTPENTTLKQLVDCIQQKRHISILSQGGTGKSTLVAALRQYLSIHRPELSFYVTSSTGVSAYLIRGTTVHSYSGIGVLFPRHSVNDVVKKIAKNKLAMDRIKRTDVLVIDEISMLGASYLDMMNETFQRIRNNPRLFGGMTLIVTGDFYQLPPIDEAYAFESKVWKEMNFYPIHLTKVYRFTDEVYAGMMGRIREAQHTPEDNVELFKRVRAYHDLDIENMEIQPTFLTSRRMNVDEINTDELRKNANEMVIYPAIDDVKRDVTFDLMAPARLQLKVNAQVMLVVNVDVEAGLTNGARGVVTELGSDIIKVKFLCGDILPFERHEFKVEEEGKVIGTRRQFPFILAYALTIHKCQGSTLDFAIVDAGNSIFQSHMTYVSLSRVRSLSGLFLKAFNPYKITVDPKVVDFYTGV